MALKDDPAEHVRAAVWRALAEAPMLVEVPVALSAWPRALSDSTDEDARVAIAGFLRAAWKKDSTGWTAGWIARLRSLAPPQDLAERRRAIELFPLEPSWTAPATVALHPLRWYEDVVRDIVRPSLAGKPLRARLRTRRGNIDIDLLGVEAPLTVENLRHLSRLHYFRDIRWHRVVPGFVVQTGDPSGTGSGGPGYAIRDELSRVTYARGALGMALSGADTGGSQWFLTLTPQPHLDGRYTVFGRVTRGWVVLDEIVGGDMLLDVEIP
jgi:cyclophilin family peptidyl-prolyl cis-trans isomerase